MSEADFKQKGSALIDELEARVERLVDSALFIEEVRKLIIRSRSSLKGDKVEESLRSYEKALAKIEKAEASIAAERLAWKLFVAEVSFLFLLLLLGYVTFRWDTSPLWRDLIYLPRVQMHIRTAWFGALGGVTIALYGLYSHVQARDFDPKYKMWYLSKPLTGAIFGWFVFLIYFIGLISVQGLDGVKIKTPELPYVIAFLAGFSERFTTRIIDRLMSVLMTWEEKPGGAQNAK